jgi:hypothetical protein
MKTKQYQYIRDTRSFWQLYNLCLIEKAGDKTYFTQTENQDRSKIWEKHKLRITVFYVEEDFPCNVVAWKKSDSKKTGLKTIIKQ